MVGLVLVAKKNSIYNFEREYTRWEAVFPGNFVPVLKIEGNC